MNEHEQESLRATVHNLVSLLQGDGTLDGKPGLSEVLRGLKDKLQAVEALSVRVAAIERWKDGVENKWKGSMWTIHALWAVVAAIILFWKSTK